jgi:hypothetical protein
VSSAILNVTFDCHDARLVAEFWAAVTGYTLEEMRDPGNHYWVASPRDGAWPRLVFVTVPEQKVVKNRVHLDIVPRDRDQDGEVDRLVGLGATLVDDRRTLSPGVGSCSPTPRGTNSASRPCSHDWGSGRDWKVKVMRGDVHAFAQEKRWASNR